MICWFCKCKNERTAMNDTSQAELLPCPHCGGQAAFDHDDDGSNWIDCGQCGASTNQRYSTGDDCLPILAEQWNRRVQPERVTLSDAKIFEISGKFSTVYRAKSLDDVAADAKKIIIAFNELKNRLQGIMRYDDSTGTYSIPATEFLDSINVIQDAAIAASTKDAQ